MLDLEKSVTDAIRSMEIEGRVDTAIKKTVEETVSSCITDALRPYSGFGKALREKITEEMNIDLGKLTLAAYNDTVLKLVEQQLNGCINEQLRTQMDSFLKGLLSAPPKEVKLSSLLEEFIKMHEENAIEDRWETCSFHMKSDGNFHHVYMDASPDVDYYLCSYAFMLHEHKLTNLRLDRSKVADKLFVGQLYGFERTLFQLYAAKTEIIIDIDEHSADTSYGIDE